MVEDIRSLKIKICGKALHPRELRFASKRNPGHTYVVVTESLFNDDFCTCPGWRFRETCSHVDDARQTYCHWWAEEYGGDRCPECGGDIEDFETDSEWD